MQIKIIAYQQGIPHTKDYKYRKRFHVIMPLYLHASLLMGHNKGI